MKAIEILEALLNNLVISANPGQNLLDLERTAQTSLDLTGAISCNKGYAPSGHTPFPTILCTSVNEEIAHAPSCRDYILQNGDLLTIDCGLNVDNFCADAAITISIGTISSRDERLLRYAKQATNVGISVIKPGVKITEVGKAIEQFANQNGYVIVKQLAGHGIGKTMHEEPTIPMYDIGQEEYVEIDKKHHKRYSYKDFDNIPVFKEGQIVCIEPHLTYKDEFGILDDDGWTLRSRDGKRSAMFESMVKVTKEGSEILL